MSFNKENHWNTAGRASVIACASPAERAAASDKLRAKGFTRLYYFQTVGGQYCVEGLRDGQAPISPESLEPVL